MSIVRKAIRSSLTLILNAAVLSTFAASAFAQNAPVPAGGPAGAPGQPQQPGAFGMMVPLLLMFGVMYFLLIRPQQKKLREQQAMVAALKEGDEVVTSSGILGKITSQTDKVVTLEVSDNVRIKVLKSAVAQVVKGQIKDLG